MRKRHQKAADDEEDGHAWQDVPGFWDSGQCAHLQKLCAMPERDLSCREQSQEIEVVAAVVLGVGLLGFHGVGVWRGLPVDAIVSPKARREASVDVRRAESGSARASRSTR